MAARIHHLLLVYRLTLAAALFAGLAALAIGQVRAEDPSRPTADLTEKGRRLQRTGRDREALAAYEAALRTDPGSIEAVLGRGEALVQLQRYPEALSCFDRYLAKGGSPDADVHQLRGLVRAKLGQYAGAIADYSRSLQLEPQSTTQAYRGWAYLVTEAPRKALDDFDAAIQLDPTNGDAYNGRGFAQLKLGDYRAAVADAVQSVRLGPETPRLFVNAARIHAQAVGILDAAAEAANGPPHPMRSEYQERALCLLGKALGAAGAGAPGVLARARRCQSGLRPDSPQQGICLAGD